MNKMLYFKIVSIFFLSALLTACRLEGDIEALRKKSVENPDPSISAPDTVTVIESDSILTVNWTVVEGATAYEVWAGTANNSNMATKRGDDVSGLSAVITDLTNSTTYYVWVKAKNSVVTSGFSHVASGTPSVPVTAPQAPSTPAVSVGNEEITVTWMAVQEATAYEVWLGTENNSATAAKHGEDVSGTTVTLTNLTNGTIYYVWLKAKNSIGTSGFSPFASGTPSIPVTAPQAPSTPTVSVGNEQITVIWAAVQGATAYEVWLATANNPATAAKQGEDVFGTTVTLTDLANSTTYYVWLKAKNPAGTSEFSPVASGKPLGTPEAPTVSPAYEQLLVTWTAVPGADEYEVYYGTDTTPTTLATTTTENTATITGLTNGTTYYVRLKAKNATGISDYGTTTNNTPGTPGLYRGAEKIGNQNLSDALSYISSNVVSGDDFYIVLGADESISPPINLNFSGKTVGITLVGYDIERTITFTSSSIFIINSGLTIILDKIILLNETINENLLGAVVSGGIFTMNGGTISGFHTGVAVSGGTFTMNNGTISGNTNRGVLVFGDGTFTMNGGVISENSSYGGVEVGNDGTFIMNGGTIIKNENKEGNGGGVTVNGTFTMYNGVISGNTADRFGGGVFVVDSGSFTMHGGVISGNIAGDVGGGVFVSGNPPYGGTFKKLPYGSGQNSGIIYGNEETGVDADGAPLKNTTTLNYGHAVYTNSSYRYRNTTAGQTDQIDSTTGKGLSVYGIPPYGE